MSYLDTIKPSVRAMQAYHLKQVSAPVKLNQNESPYDVPEWLKQEILSEFGERSWHRYPSFGNLPLLEQLAEHCGLSPESVLVGNGSNELLQVLMSATVSPGKKVLLVTPTFSVYRQLAQVAGATVCEIEFDEEWHFPVGEILSRLETETFDLCILCSPNSPTGSLLPTVDLETILAKSRGLVVLDEAYHEFTEQKNLPLLQQFPNLVVTRTFSKAIGLAGLRVGYLLADEKLVVEFNKAKLPYNLNMFSELTACKLLQNSEVIQERVAASKAEMQRVIASVREIPGVQVLPSAGNFYLVKTGMQPERLFEQLLSQGVLVRDVSGYHKRLARTLRVSVGTPEENERFLLALQLTLQKNRRSES